MVEVLEVALDASESECRLIVAPFSEPGSQRYVEKRARAQSSLQANTSRLQHGRLLGERDKHREANGDEWVDGGGGRQGGVGK